MLEWAYPIFAIVIFGMCAGAFFLILIVALLIRKVQEKGLDILVIDFFAWLSMLIYNFNEKFEARKKEKIKESLRE